MALLLGLLVAALLVLPASAKGQIADTAAATAGATVPKAVAPADPYAAESLVVERMDTVYTYAADGTGSKQITAVMHMQSDASARQYSVLTIPFAGSNEHVEIDYVRVRKPDGTVVETPPEDAQEMPQEVTRQAPFYSDLKEKQVPVRRLGVGDKLEYSVRIVRTRAEVPGQFWGEDGFGVNVVVLDAEIELHVPKAMYVKVWNPDHAPVVSEAGSEKIYRWKGSQLKPTVGAAAEAAKKTAPPEPPEGPLAPVAWTTFKSWAAVGAWYRGLEADRAVPDADVKAKVAELIADKKPGVPLTDEEKRRAIYHYVSTQIRYIGVAFGVGRYQPHLASEVLRNQYGDCKDKYTLLAAMMSVAGYKTQSVLIGAGIRMNEDVPSPAAFNHLIATLPEGDKTVWLDTTMEVAPYGMLLYQLRDKQALVIPDSGAARLEKTPANPPFAPLNTFDATGTLDKDGTVNSHMVYTLRSDNELLVRIVLRQVPPGQWDQFVQAFSQRLGFGGTTSHVEASRPDATEAPLKLTYDYERKKLGDWDNYKIVPLFPMLSFTTVDEANPPRQPIELGARHVEMATTVITLPQGWGAQLPDPIHQKTAFATFDQTYRLDHKTLTVERKVEILESKVPATDWKSYKKFLDATVTDGERYIQLTSTGEPGGEKGPPPPSTEETEPARLIREAGASLQQHDITEAQEKLDKAKSINPQQPLLWSGYGYVALLQGAMNLAVENFKKELDLHPDEHAGYDILAQVQTVLGHRADAEDTLRKRLKLLPGEVAPTLTLAQLLLDDGEAAEAATLLEAAEAKAAEGRTKQIVQMQLGTALVQSGQKERGVATMTALLKVATDPIVLNGAAYGLAEAGADLELADQGSRHALETLTNESAKWRLDGTPRGQLNKSTAIVALWDTVGWVLFKEGKLAEAEGYIRAAWKFNPDAEVGLHLGQIDEARGYKQAALETYTLARSIRPSSPSGPSPLPKRVDAELKRRYDGLWQKGVRSPMTNMNEELQKMRRLPIGDAGGRNGFSNYDFLMSEGRVVEVQPEKGSPTGLQDGDVLVRKIVFPGWMPPGSTAKLLRRGALNCHSGKCEFVVFPQ